MKFNFTTHKLNIYYIYITLYLPGCILVTFLQKKKKNFPFFFEIELGVHLFMILITSFSYFLFSLSI